jgi:hypothetical protein
MKISCFNFEKLVTMRKCVSSLENQIFRHLLWQQHENFVSVWKSENLPWRENPPKTFYSLLSRKKKVKLSIKYFNHVANFMCVDFNYNFFLMIRKTHFPLPSCLPIFLFEVTQEKKLFAFSFAKKLCVWRWRQHIEKDYQQFYESFLALECSKVFVFQIIRSFYVSHMMRFFFTS